jgi:transposase
MSVFKNYVGIDVSSKKLNINIVGDNNHGDYEIPNDKKSLREFINEQGISPDTYSVGAESTSRFHLICQETFVLSGFEFRLLNPILTGKKISSSIRKKKTDISDARIIADLLMRGEGNVITKKQLETDKRTVLRTRKTVVNHKTSVKILLKNIKLIDYKNNIRIKETINSLTKLIGKMEKTISELEGIAENCACDVTDEALIKSIPGFATNLAAVVSTEVGDFNRFPSSTQFKAYVGIDPKVTQSGDKLKNGHITKRGNAYLRNAFYLAAQVARCHDPELKAFYEKKKGEGKPTRVAICAVSRKLCERVYAVVTKKTPYEIRQLSFS